MLLQSFIPAFQIDGMKVKLLALDVDGTITDEDNSVDLDAVFTIKNVTKMGLRPIFITGRSLWEAYSLTAFIGLERIGAAENGGVIFYRSPHNVLLLGDLAEPTRALEALSKELDITIRNTMPRFTEITLERPVDINLANEILEKNGIRARALDSGYAVHLVNDTVNKGIALERIMKLLQVSRNETASIGDSVIDIPMFKASSISFAVSNSSEYVKKEASYVTSGRSGKGVVEAISKLLAYE